MTSLVSRLLKKSALSPVIQWHNQRAWCSVVAGSTEHTMHVRRRIESTKKAALLGGGVKRIEKQHKKVFFRFYSPKLNFVVFVHWAIKLISEKLNKYMYLISCFFYKGQKFDSSVWRTTAVAMVIKVLASSCSYVGGSWFKPRLGSDIDLMIGSDYFFTKQSTFRNKSQGVLRMSWQAWHVNPLSFSIQKWGSPLYHMVSTS